MTFWELIIAIVCGAAIPIAVTIIQNVNADKKESVNISLHYLEMKLDKLNQKRFICDKIYRIKSKIGLLKDNIIKEEIVISHEHIVEIKECHFDVIWNSRYILPYCSKKTQAIYLIKSVELTSKIDKIDDDIETINHILDMLMALDAILADETRDTTTIFEDYLDKNLKVLVDLDHIKKNI